MESRLTTESSPKKESSSNKIVMDTTEVERVELCFVSSVDKETRSFFAQFCKFENKDLIEHNIMINQYCNKLINELDLKPKKFHKGDIICARYSTDGNWYRAKVLKHDSKNQRVSLIFLDYGNLESVTFQETVCVSSQELPLMTRAPFGVTCSPQGIENLSRKESDHLLECLSDTYAMIHMLSPLTSLQWLVEIPKHAYNKAFWDVYQPGALKQSGLEKIRMPAGEDTK